MCSNTIKRTVKSKNLELFEDGKLIVKCDSDFEAVQFMLIIGELYDLYSNGTKGKVGYYSKKDGWLLYESSIPTFPLFIKPNILNFKEFAKQEKEEMEKTNFEVYFEDIRKSLNKNLKKYDNNYSLALCNYFMKVTGKNKCLINDVLEWLFSNYKPTEYKEDQYIVFNNKVYIIDKVNKTEDPLKKVIICKSGPTLYNTNSSIDHELSRKLNS